MIVERQHFNWNKMKELILEFKHRSGVTNIDQLIAIIGMVLSTLVEKYSITINDEFLNKHRKEAISLFMMILHNSIVTKQHFVWD